MSGKIFSFPDCWQMFAQIYFGGISSTLLSFLPKELKEYFKNTLIFPLSIFFPSVASYFFSLLLSFCAFFLDLLGFNMDFIICHSTEQACYGQGRLDLLCCNTALAFSASVYVANWSRCNSWRNFCQPSQSHRPLFNAKLVLTTCKH